MMSVKMERVLANLSSHYMPFTLLSPERLSQGVNVVHFVELRKDESLQIRGGKDNDYRYVVEGRLEIAQCGSVRFFNGPEDQKPTFHSAQCAGYRNQHRPRGFHYLPRGPGNAQRPHCLG